MSTYLTKTAFKLGRSCPTKLFFYLSGYECSVDEDEYADLLAKGGHLIGKLAQLKYPEGVLIDKGQGIERALRHTEELMGKEHAVVFEATFLSRGKLAAVDILEKRGNLIRLIEVKSKSYDSEEAAKKRAERGHSMFFGAKKTSLSSEWAPYIDDIAFQTLVVSERYPECRIEPILMLVDNRQPAAHDKLVQYFSITERGKLEIEVTVVRQPPPDAGHFLVEVPVAEEVEFVLPEVREASELFFGSISPVLRKLPSELSADCSGCEFKGGNARGFKECWGELAEVTPHIFDLYYGTAIKQQKERLFDILIRERKVSLFDIPEAALSGKRGDRQLIQIHYTEKKTEWFSSALAGILAGFPYPHFFIDFETTKSALPWYLGMTPFEDVAFQWSCHRVEEEGAAPTHSEWINTEDENPNLRFIRALMECIGSEGTIFTWAAHEKTILSAIGRALDETQAEVKEWIDEVVKGASLRGRLVDLNQLTLEHYFHPEMKGKTSLKYVLPAVWRTSKTLRTRPWLKEYVREEDGELINPYDTLPPMKVGAEERVVKVGTAAMIAYEQLIRGPVEERDQWRQLLLQYCKLDTLAMVMVFEHWRECAPRS